MGHCHPRDLVHPYLMPVPCCHNLSLHFSKNRRRHRLLAAKKGLMRMAHETLCYEHSPKLSNIIMIL